MHKYYLKKEKAKNDHMSFTFSVALLSILSLYTLFKFNLLASFQQYFDLFLTII